MRGLPNLDVPSGRMKREGTPETSSSYAQAFLPNPCLDAPMHSPHPELKERAGAKDTETFVVYLPIPCPSNCLLPTYYHRHGVVISKVAIYTLKSHKPLNADALLP